MRDGDHIAVKGGFKGKLLLPDGTTEWTYARRTDATVDRANTKDQAPIVMKLDVSKPEGSGPGTTGWAKEMDGDASVGGYGAGGVTVYSVGGDASGNMIVSLKGCTAYDATAESTDRYGRTVLGAATGCKYYIVKLAANDGSEMWKFETPTNVRPCRVIADGSFFCGFSVSAGTVYDFLTDAAGAAVTFTGTATATGIVKYDTNGKAVWAKESLAKSYSGDLAVNSDGTLLAIIASGGSGSPALVARIDTSAGNEGNVLWQDGGGVGTHGFRGVEVTGDPTAAIQEVQVFGQVTGTETLTDMGGATTTLRSRGSYEVFVAAYDASNGAGKYAMDGGGTGMEYFFAFARDQSTGDLYIGGTSRSEQITWGNVARDNVMYNGQPGENNPDTSSPVGSSKAFTVKLLTSTSMPECLQSCTGNGHAASDVKDGHCYIDRYCYAHGAAAPYDGAQCMHCNATVSKTAWTNPGKWTDMCFIGSTCYNHGDMKTTTSGYSTVTSECEMCDASKSTSVWSAHSGYEFVNGACHKVTWQDQATMAGWIPPRSCTA